jgi:hypothetical protein
MYKKYKPQYPNRMIKLRTMVDVLIIAYNNKMYENMEDKLKFEHYKKELSNVEKLSKKLDAKGITKKNYLYKILNSN